MPTRSEALLQQFTQLHPKTIDLTLTRMARLLRALGEPQKRLAPAIHIAGTNGKGSVLAYLQAMYHAAGQRVQAYISPHLMRFHERIVLNGTPIRERQLAEVLTRCLRANAGLPITFFEATTAAAFCAFADTPADILLLEVGLGGRLDATNCATNIAASVITTIGRDHTEYLGKQLGQIAQEKAGILRPNVPAILGRIAKPQYDRIAMHAQARATPLQTLGDAFSWRRGKTDWVFRDAKGAVRLPPPALAGRHQYDNAAIAVAVARQLGLAPSHIAQGIASACWPARLEALTLAQWPDLRIWLDGGHNAMAARALAHWARGNKTTTPLYLVTAMLNTKDPQAFFAPFATLATQCLAVPLPDSPNGYAPDTLAQHAIAAGLRAQACTSLSQALTAITKRAPDARVLICGSLYLAGQLLRDFLPART